MKKMIALLLAALMICAMFTGCGEKGTTLKSVQKAGKLTIATSPDFPPFESLGDNNEVVGIEIDVLNLICEQLGVTLEINQKDFDSVLPGVQAGKFEFGVSGVSVTKTIMGVFLYAGLMYGIASFLEGARIQSVGTATGINYELDAIAGCVIGGVSFNGGIGTVPGVVLGSIILQAINYGLYFLGVNAYLQYIIRGAIIIIAVAIDVQKYVAKK